MTLTALGASLTTSLPLCCSIDSVQEVMALLRTNIPCSCPDHNKIHKLLSIARLSIELNETNLQLPLVEWILNTMPILVSKSGDINKLSLLNSPNDVL